MDFGGSGVCRLEGAVADPSGKKEFFVLGRVFISDNEGKSWEHTTDFPFCHARPFVAGNSLYVIGHNGDLKIMRSDDWGETWGDVSTLTKDESWHQAPSNVWYANGCIYLVMERITDHNTGWPVNSIAPVLMRGKVEDNLLKRENWTFASELIFNQAISERDLHYTGMQVYDAAIENHKYAQPLGWLEAQVIQFKNPDDIWTDITGHTFHLFARTNTGLPNSGAMLRVEEHADGTMITCLQKTPSGKEIALINIPGGHIKFHILYDDQSGYYWLLSNQCTDGLKSYTTVPAYRGDPVHERHRLVLHFSKNCFDWCFAGVVAIGAQEIQSRSYASMAIKGDNLLIVSRSGDENTKSNHDTDLITFHTVKDFRSLIY